MNNIKELKQKFDNYQIDVTQLSIDEVNELCNIYDKEIDEIDKKIEDLEFQIEKNKNAIRKNIDKMREINNNRKLNNKQGDA